MRRLTPVLILFVVLFAAVKPVYAANQSLCAKDLPPEECMALLLSYEKWVPLDGYTATCTTGGTATAPEGSSIELVGKDNPHKAYNYFMQYEGLTNVQSAAVVGNFVVESGVDPKINQEGGGPGRGIAQWSATERWAVLLKFAEGEAGNPADDKDPFELVTQLEFVSRELHGKAPAGDYSGVLENLKNQSDITEAVGWFMGTDAAEEFDPATDAFMAKHGRISGYENPGTPHMDKRIEAAKAALQNYGGVVGSGAGCTTGGAVYCDSNAPETSSVSPLRQQVVCLAEAELARWESGEMKPGGDFYKYTNNGRQDEQWCADFISWLYDSAGYPVKDSGDKWERVAFAFKDLDKFDYHEAGSYTPVPGDVAIYSYSHVNLVVSVNTNARTFEVIGGNQGGNVSGTGTDSQVSKYVINTFTGSDVIGFASPKESE